MPATPDRWTDGAQYEAYIGRWSRLVAPQFLRWLAVPPGRGWLDFGCGSGALTQAILADADPRALLACDRAAAYVDHLRRQLADRRVTCRVLALEDLAGVAPADVLVSGLVLNFLPDPAAALATFRAATAPGGTVAAYVWDYAEGMRFLRVFWDVAAELDASARPLDESVRFPVCRPEALTDLFREARLRDVTATALTVPTVFRDFDDLWQPFLGGQGPAPSYVQGLTAERRAAVRERYAKRLGAVPGESLSLTARAWAVRGIAA